MHLVFVFCIDSNVYYNQRSNKFLFRQEDGRRVIFFTFFKKINVSHFQLYRFVIGCIIEMTPFFLKIEVLLWQCVRIDLFSSVYSK